MANICWFKGIIKGNEMNCEKFIEIFPCYDILDLKSVGCLQETAMAFCGTSAWGICAYADNEEKVIPLTEEAIATISDKDANQYSKYRLVDLAVLFDVEIMINSVCEDDVKVSNYEHYVRGYRLDDDLPNALKISNKEIKSGLSISKIKLEAFVLPTLISDRKKAIKAIKSRGKNLMYLTDELRGDPEIVTIATKSSSEAFKYASDKLKNDLPFINEIIKESPGILEYLSDELKNNYKIVSIAVTKYPGVLRYASKELKNNEVFALKALSYGLVNPEDRDCYGEQILRNKEFALEAIRTDGFYYYSLMDDSLRNDRELALLAIKHWKVNAQFVGKALFSDKTFVIEMLEILNQKDREGVIKSIRDRLPEKFLTDPAICRLLKGNSNN